MKNSVELEFPVLNGILMEFIEQGATIKKQDGEIHLFAIDGDSLASGEKVTNMLVNLILRHG